MAEFATVPIGLYHRAVLKKILIVEDEAPIREALTRRLRARGYLPTPAPDSNAALARFDAGRPDLLIVSLTLPDDGGPRLCREVRARPMGALVPILFLGSGQESIKTAGEAIAAGADHFAIKPDGLDELLVRVARYIGPGDPDAVFEGQPEAVVSQLDPARLLAEPELTAPPIPRPDVWSVAPSPLEQTVVPQPAQLKATTPPLTLANANPDGYAAPIAPAEDKDAPWWALLDPGRSRPLEARGVATILAAAMKARLTGRVEISSGGVLRRIFFGAGAVIYVDSSNPDEDLLASLAADGRIARGVLLRARKRSAETGAAAEAVLIESGFVQPDDLYRALREHVIERTLALFALEAGQGLVVRGGPRPIDSVDLGQHPGRLILDGTRRKFGRLRLYRAFGTASAVPRPNHDAVPPTGFVLRPDEEAVWKTVDGHRSVVDIAQAARVGEVDALAILHGLSVLDLVEPPGGRVPSVLPPLSAEQLERAGAPRTADQMPGFAELVGAKRDEARSADYYQVLGVARDATNAEIKAAYERLRRRFDPHRVRRDGPLHGAVTEICEVLDDGYAILAEPRLRSRYAAALRGR